MEKRNVYYYFFLFGVVCTVATVFVVPENSLAEESTKESTEEDQEEIEETKEDIEDIEEELEEVVEEKEKLQKNLGQIQSSLNSAQVQINATQSFIQETESIISRKEREIQNLEKKLKMQKSILSSIIQDMYYIKESSYIETLLQVEKFIGMRALTDSFLDIHENMQTLVRDVNATREEVEQEKFELESNKKEKENLLEIQDAQKQALVSNKNTTQSKIYKKDATIGQLQARLSKLQGELNSLLGKSYDATDIKDAAKFASKVTGVRKDFLMGMLVVESDLGRYTGGCTYDEVSKGAKKAYKDGRLSKKSYERMKYRKDIFEEIIDELGHDEDDVKVSCNPASYAGTGGAMGVPQFMSDTWMGYKSSIAAATGHNPPDPWNLTDGVAAMAIKLAKVPGVTSHKESAECDAAKLYLSGTTSSKYNWYCEKVLYWAENYKDKL